MLNVRLIVTGKIKESYFKAATEEYIKRLSRFINLEIIEIEDYADNNNACIREGKEILKLIKGKVILLDVAGEELTSIALSKRLDRLMTISGFVTFIIGGSNGASEEVKAAADELISFSKLTFPHQLFRVIFLEQLYRACTILNGINYHK